MKRKVIMKRVGAMAMAAMLATSTTSTAMAASDIYGHWAEAVMTQWRNSGLISGYGDGTLRPDNLLTRAQLVQLMNNSLGFSTQGFLNFTDVKQTDWFYKAVNIAINSGYATGATATLFAPDAIATRAQAALFVSNAIGDNTGSVSQYSDAASIPTWAVGAVGAMTKLGYMSGMPDGSFAPNSPLTRAQAVSMLDRVRQNFTASPYVYTGGAFYMGDFFGASSTTTTTTSTSSSGYTMQGTNVIITEDGGILKDMVVEGDVTISSSVGDGDATLDNVTVHGDIIVEGGGSASISLIDTTADGTLILDKENVRVVLSGSTEIKKAEFWEAAHLDSYSSYSGTINQVTFPTRISKSNDCTIDVDVESIFVEKAISLVLEALVEELYIASGAAGTLLDVTKYAEIDDLVIDGRVDIVGSGTIGFIEVNVGGVTIDKDITVDDMEVADGIEPPVYGDSDADSDTDDDTDDGTGDGTDTDTDADDSGTGGTGDDDVPATVPALNAEPLITRTTASTASISFSVNQPGKYAIRIVENELTDEQLSSKSAFNEIENSEGMHISNMADSINAYTLQTAVASSLTANTAYFVYMMFEDENGNYRITDGYELTSQVAAAVVTTATELNAAVSIANGEVVKLGRDISTEATITMPIPAGVNIDLNGYTMGTLNVTQSISTISISETAVPTGTVKIQNSSSNGKITKLNIASGVDTVYVETDVDTAVLTDVVLFETTHANADVNQIDVESNKLSSEIPTIKNSAGNISKMSTKTDVILNTNLEYLEIMHSGSTSSESEEVVVTLEKGNRIDLVDTLKRTTIIGEGAVSEIDIDVSSGTKDIIVVVGPYITNKQGNTDASSFVVYQYGDRDTENLAPITPYAYQSNAADGGGSAVAGWTPITVNLKVAVPVLGDHEAMNGYDYALNLTVPYGHIWLYAYEYTSINENVLPVLDNKDSTFADLLLASNTYPATGTNAEQAETVTILAPYLKNSDADGTKKEDYITNEKVTVEINAIAATASSYANRTGVGVGTITFLAADFSKWDALIDQYNEYAADKDEYTYGSWDTFKAGVEKYVGDYYDPDTEKFVTGVENTVLVGQKAIDAAVIALGNYLSGNEWLLVYKDEYDAGNVSLSGVTVSVTDGVCTKTDGAEVALTLNNIDANISAEPTYTLKQDTKTIIDNEKYTTTAILLATDAADGTYTLEITVPWSTNTSTTVLTYTIKVGSGENPVYAPDPTVAFTSGVLSGKTLTGTAGEKVSAVVSYGTDVTGVTATYSLTKTGDTSFDKTGTFTLGTEENLLLDTAATEGTYTLVITSSSETDGVKDSTLTYTIVLEDPTVDDGEEEDDELADLVAATASFTNTTKGANDFTYNYSGTAGTDAVDVTFILADVAGGDTASYQLKTNGGNVVADNASGTITETTKIDSLIGANAVGTYELVVTTINDKKNPVDPVTYTIEMPERVSPVPTLEFTIGSTPVDIADIVEVEGVKTISVPFSSIDENISLKVADMDGADSVTATVDSGAETPLSTTVATDIITAANGNAGTTKTVTIKGTYTGTDGEEGSGTMDEIEYKVVFADADTEISVPVPTLTFAIDGSAVTEEDNTINVPCSKVGTAVSLAVGNIANTGAGDLTSVTVNVTDESEQSVGSEVKIDSTTVTPIIIGTDADAGETYTITITGEYRGATESETETITPITYTIVFAEDDATSVRLLDSSVERTSATDATVSFELDTDITGYKLVEAESESEVATPADTSEYEKLTDNILSTGTDKIVAGEKEISMDDLLDNDPTDDLYLVIEHTATDGTTKTYKVFGLEENIPAYDDGASSSISLMSYTNTAMPSGEVTPITSSMVTTGIVTGVDSAVVMSGGTPGTTVTIKTADGSALASDATPIVKLDKYSSGNVILTITAKKGATTSLATINSAIAEVIALASTADETLSDLSVTITGTFGLPLYTTAGTLMTATTLK
ncbi:MAG: S-layer homology domain-containing protein [Bacillota bacterium]